MLAKVLLKIVVFTFCILSYAQGTITPEWIDIESGLSQGHISAMLQDEEGFLWMGTKNGLNRYDGESFEIFTDDAENPYAITGNYIYSLHDGDGFILVGTNEALNIFDKQTKRFYKIPFEANKTKYTVTTIIKEKANQYWLAEVHTSSLFQLTLSDDFLTKLRQGSQISEVISIQKNEHIKNIYPFFISKYHDDQLLFVSQVEQENGTWDKSFHTLNTKTGEILKLDSTPFKRINSRYKFVVANNTIILAFWSEKKLHVFQNNNWKELPTDFTVKTLSYLDEGKQLLIDSDVGYLIFDESILSHPEIKSSETNLIIPKTRTNHTTWLQDISGNHWIGTNGYGVVKIGSRQANIKTYFSGKSIYAKPFILSSGDVYIGNPTTQERLFIPKTTLGITRLKRFSHIKNKDLCDLIEDKTGTIWGLYWENGEYKIAKEINEKVVDIKVTSIGNNIIAPAMYYSTENHEIVLISNAALTIYDIDNNDLNIYDFTEQFGFLMHRYTVVKTANGIYWIGTNSGLIKATKTNTNVTFKLFNKENGLLSNEVATLYPDIHDQNILWIGTKGSGLHQLNMNDMSFEYINSKNGLPNDVIYGVLEDDKKNLWMSSNLGIISYNKLTKEIRNFQKSDGLQSNEFNTYAYAQSPDGTFYFGGINGLNSFKPSDFGKNQNLPKTWITGLEVNNKEVSFGDNSELLSKSIEHAEQITLTYDQNNITLHFAALEYSASDKNKFKYYLEGAEKEWAHTTTDNKANYLNLAPGNYVFKLKTANGDEVWNSVIKQLNIKILAPWYRSNLAYIIYTLSGIAILLLIIKIREDKIKSKQQIEKSKLENKLLNQKLDTNKQELKRFTDLLVKNSEENKVLTEELEKIKKETDTTSFQNLENLLNTRILTDKQWLLFKEKFTAVYPDFFYELRNKSHTFSEAEERLLVLEKLNLKPKEIAAILGIAGPSVSRAKHRLKTKLGIDKTVDTINFLEL